MPSGGFHLTHLGLEVYPLFLPILVVMPPLNPTPIMLPSWDQALELLVVSGVLHTFCGQLYGMPPSARLTSG